MSENNREASRAPESGAAGKPTTAASRLVWNAMSNYLRFAVMMAGMLVLTPFIISNIGASDYGLWMLAASFVGYFELLDCGFATATVKFVGQYLGAGDVERRNKLASTLLAVYVLMAALVGLLAIALSYGFNSFFGIVESQQQKALIVLLAMSLKVALNLPLALFLGVLFGQQRIVEVNIIRVVAYVLYAGSVWFALDRGCGVVEIALLNAVVFFTEHLAFYIVCRMRTPDLQLSLGMFDLEVFREAASFSVFAMVTNVSTVMLLRTDPIVVKLFLPLSAVAMYALSLKISEQILLLTKQFINVFTPHIAQLHGVGDRAGVREAFLNSSRFGLASLAVIAIPLMYWSTEAIELWVGIEFAGAGPILLVLVLAMHFRVLQEAASNALGMTGEHRYVAITSVISAVLNLMMSLILIAPMGMLGVAAATLISNAAVGVWVVVGRARRKYDVSGFEYCRRVAAPLVAPMGLQLVVCAFLRTCGLPLTLLQMVLYCAASSAASYWR